MQSQQIWRSSILLLSMVRASIASSATANDLRIETEIFVEDDSTPASSCLTLFSGTTVYDFLNHESSLGDITVFDVSRGRFVLIDAQRKLKTTFTKDYLLKFFEQIKTQASDEVVARFVTPKL